MPPGTAPPESPKRGAKEELMAHWEKVGPGTRRARAWMPWQPASRRGGKQMATILWVLPIVCSAVAPLDQVAKVNPDKLITKVVEAAAQVAP
jgi:hypothetical protein